MRLKISKSKNAASLYVIKSFRENGVNTSKVVETLGTEKELREKLGGKDPYIWAKNYIEELNRKEKENSREIIARFSPVKQIEKNQQNSYNGGYLFLQDIYYKLKLDTICKKISATSKITFDLNDVLKNLIYGRLIYPASKKATYELAARFIESPKFDIQHLYRSLDILSKNSDEIQASLYQNTKAVIPRNNKILFYDCTNFFFETEHEEGIKQYGVSKEHRPNPIVQMGLFLDGDGMPLTFSINPGNQNEQVSLRPLEKKIISDFNLSEFIVCTDAGLSSLANRKFNSVQGRSFITTQSVKNLKDYQTEWATDKSGWYLSGDKKGELHTINGLDKGDENDRKKVFYKERWINEDGLEQRLIVTYCLKYDLYQKNIRNSQIERALKALKKNPKLIDKKRATDFKRFIESETITNDGEIADTVIYSINQERIDKEAFFDGYYAVCTNLESEASEIIKINKGRWEIEESFRIMKNEFKSRPVFLKRDERIKAHFLTCFISLIIYRILEKKLNDQFTCREITSGLRDMNFHDIKGEGYAPSYTRNDFTDALHDAFGFRTDYEIIPRKNLKNILKETKSR